MLDHEDNQMIWKLPALVITCVLKGWGGMMVHDKGKNRTCPQQQNTQTQSTQSLRSNIPANYIVYAVILWTRITIW